MFSKSLKQIMGYTLPVVVSRKSLNGKIECSCGTFIILNDEGWILTAAHMLETIEKYNQDRAEMDQYEKKVKKIELNSGLEPKQKNKKIKKLPRNPEWVTKFSYWWGNDLFDVSEFTYDIGRDIAIGKIESFDGGSIANYPVFKNPASDMLPGTSLCKLGFPFHLVTATFDQNLDQFRFADGTLPIPFFPLDGIFTRFAILKDEISGREIKYLETSTPGLKGQSGGPIFDTDGHIWALQSYTTHLPLGFNPSISQGNKNIEEYQFLNVGCGTHVEEIVNFLKENDIKIQLSEK